MSSSQHCLAMADEADRLAGIVSYERDKTRLRSQADAWRQMARALSEPVEALAVASDAQPALRMKKAVGMAGWLGRRWA